MRKCIDSILAQTFSDFECLLIDDGSTDGSPAICDEYALKDERIKVFHKQNGGLSDARNYGLEKAQGEYTIFADPDDWVDAEGLDLLYKKAIECNADMAMCDIYYNDKYHQYYRKQEPSSLNHIDVLRDLIVGRIYGFTVTKLIRRSLYKKYNILYPKGLYGIEDQYAISKILKNDIKIAYIPIAYYHYMHYGNATLSRRYDDNTYYQDLKIRKLFVDLFNDYPNLQATAYHIKSHDILSRAFFLGENVYSASSFKERFKDYKPFVKSRDALTTKLLLFSIRGYYPFAKKTFNYLYKTKQGIKKIKNLFNNAI